MGVGLGASAWPPASVVIANWFGERRATALGLTTVGMESGGMMMAFTVGHLIAPYSWRLAYFTLRIPALLVALPFLALVVRTRPEGTAKPQAGEPAQSLSCYEVGEAIRASVFWMLMVAQLAWGLSAEAVIHLVAYLKGIGYTPQFATTAYSALAGLAAFGKPTMGVLADSIGGKNSLGMALLMVAASHLMVLRADNYWVLVLYLTDGRFGCFAEFASTASAGGGRRAQAVRHSLWHHPSVRHLGAFSAVRLFTESFTTLLRVTRQDSKWLPYLLRLARWRVLCASPLPSIRRTSTGDSELITHFAFYSGWPTAVTATTIAKINGTLTTLTQIAPGISGEPTADCGNGRTKGAIVQAWGWRTSPDGRGVRCPRGGDHQEFKTATSTGGLTLNVLLCLM
jgi:hypothetical protein